jgi:hypothetical protein
MRVVAALLCIVSQAWTVNANVEKTIFLGPSAVTFPDARPSLDDLHLRSISSREPVLATRLSVQFPSGPKPHGLDSWYILSDLEADRRYEVRVCWPATVSFLLLPRYRRLYLHVLTISQSPTDFWLDTYAVTQVFDTPGLISSLANFSENLSANGRQDVLKKQTTLGGAQSILFLRVQAAASYYSTNRSLMEHPPPVDVDISVLRYHLLTVFN